MATATPELIQNITDVLSTLSSTESTAAIMKTAGARVAELLASPVRHHRVQISVRGRRFETSMDVATDYCLAYYLFFGLPITRAEEQDDEAVLAATDLVQSIESDASEDATAKVSLCLRMHYTDTVLPAMETLEAALIATNASAAVPAPREALPPIPVPEKIEYDPASLQWRFNFPKRLSDELEEREHSRLQRLAVLAQHALTAQGAAATVSAALDPNGNPFILLQPDYLGVLLVYLRKAAKARTDTTTAAAGTTVRTPAFPVRWHELGYDEQVSLTQTLRALGVVPLLLTPLARPSADLEATSLYRSAHPEEVVAQGVLEDAAAGGSLRARAEKFLHEVEQINDVVDEQAYVHPSVADDLLMLPSQGCSKCGMSGHATADCPH